jgi:hypothetical protein
MAIVRADELVKEFPKPGSKTERFRAVNGVSLSIEAGEIFGILGPNVYWPSFTSAPAAFAGLPRCPYASQPERT